MSVCLSVCISLSLSFSLSVSLSPSLCLPRFSPPPFSLCVCVSLSLCLSLPLSILCLSLPLPASISLYFCLCLSVYLSLSVCPSLSHIEPLVRILFEVVGVHVPCVCSHARRVTVDHSGLCYCLPSYTCVVCQALL